VVLAVPVVALGVIAAGTMPASAASAHTQWCQNGYASEQPSSFLTELQWTGGFGSDPQQYPYMNTWSHNLESINLSRIVCAESDYVLNPAPTYNSPGHYNYGEWQVEDANIIHYLSPSNPGQPSSYYINCFRYGCAGLSNWYFQDWVAMRYIHDRWGSPTNAWANELSCSQGCGYKAT
jgi:hypothetical protein